MVLIKHLKIQKGWVHRFTRLAQKLLEGLQKVDRESSRPGNGQAKREVPAAIWAETQGQR